MNRNDEAVRHGYWSFDYNKQLMKCSCCQRKMKYSNERKFCPNCGAKMDKEEEVG